MNLTPCGELSQHVSAYIEHREARSEFAPFRVTRIGAFNSQRTVEVEKKNSLDKRRYRSATTDPSRLISITSTISYKNVTPRYTSQFKPISSTASPLTQPSSQFDPAQGASSRTRLNLRHLDRRRSFCRRSRSGEVPLFHLSPHPVWQPLSAFPLSYFFAPAALPPTTIAAVPRGNGWTATSSVLSTWSPFSRCTCTSA